MGKLSTYIIVMTGLMLLFYFGGILDECDDDGLCKHTTASSALLNLLLKVESWQHMGIWTQLVLALEGLIAGGGIIAIGVITRNWEMAVRAPITVWIANLLWDFITIFTKVAVVNVYLALLFFAPVMLLFLVTVVEWWGGTD